MSKQIPFAEVQKHNTATDLWVVINGKVYDLTEFSKSHPGGAQILRTYAGKDATSAFESLHNPIVLETLPAKAIVGVCDAPKNTEVVKVEPKKEAPKVENKGKPDLGAMLCVDDLEKVAATNITKEGWDYYQSAAEDEITLKEQRQAYRRIWLRPYVLVGFETACSRIRYLNQWHSAPIYVSATAMGKLACPEGETAFANAAFKENLPQLVSTLSSVSLDEIMKAQVPGCSQWYQLYIPEDRERAYRMVRKAEAGGIKMIALTVDTSHSGRRERDMRNKYQAPPADIQKDSIVRGAGVGSALNQFIDSSLTWKDVHWLKSITHLPIFLKGVQRGDDAIRAFRAGVSGIIVSNHGARNLDTARPTIEVLPEVIKALNMHDPAWRQQMHVFMDGGARRGTDIFKALAMGATAVGVGRPVLYGAAAYGQDGVQRALQMLKEELQITMQLVGASTIADIKPDMICKRPGDELVSFDKLMTESRL